MAPNSSGRPDHRRRDAIEALSQELYPHRSTHSEEIEGFFGERAYRPLDREERELLGGVDLFLVAFANRSGSTLLTEILHQAGLPVPPHTEVINSDTVLRICREYGMASFTDYFLRFAKGWHDGGRLGFKAGPHQMFWLSRIGLLDQFRSVRIVHSCRRDRLAQAVSLCIALQTGAWHSGMAGTAAAAVNYDREEILRCLRTIGDTEALIEYFITLHAVPSRVVYYEDLLSDPDGELAGVTRFLGAPAPQELVDMSAMNIQQQRGADNERLYTEFRREFPGL